MAQTKVSGCVGVLAQLPTMPIGSTPTATKKEIHEWSLFYVNRKRMNDSVARTASNLKNV